MKLKFVFAVLGALQGVFGAGELPSFNGAQKMVEVWLENRHNKDLLSVMRERSEAYEVDYETLKEKGFRLLDSNFEQDQAFSNIRIDGKTLGRDEADYLRDLLGKEDCFIKRLVLVNYKIGIARTLDNIGSNTSLEEFCLEGQPETAGGLKTLCEKLATNKTATKKIRLRLEIGSSLRLDSLIDVLQDPVVKGTNFCELSVGCQKISSDRSYLVSSLATLNTQTLKLEGVDNLSSVLRQVTSHMERGETRFNRLEITRNLNKAYVINHWQGHSGKLDYAAAEKFVKVAAQKGIEHNMSASEVLGLFGYTGETLSPKMNYGIDVAGGALLIAVVSTVVNVAVSSVL